MKKERNKTTQKILATILTLVLIALIISVIVAVTGSKQPEKEVDDGLEVTETAEPTPELTPEPTPEPVFVPEWDATGEPDHPYLVAVNVQTQTVTAYSKDEEGNYTVPYRAMICSTGDATPVEGKFHISDKYKWRALFGDVYGQYATRITGHILFHSVPYYSQDKGNLETEEFNKLGTEASLGCIRMQVKDVKWIQDECPVGTPVVFYEGDESTDPLGNPGFEPIDVNSPHAGWDPSDPDPDNPWNK